MPQPQEQTRKGILRGSIYPRNLRGKTVEVEVEDETWGRDHEHSLWVRLEDLHEPEPKPALAAGGYISGPSIVAWDGTSIRSDSFVTGMSYSVGVKNADPDLLKTLLGEL